MDLLLVPTQRTNTSSQHTLSDCSGVILPMVPGIVASSTVILVPPVEQIDVKGSTRRVPSTGYHFEHMGGRGRAAQLQIEALHELNDRYKTRFTNLKDAIVHAKNPCRSETKPGRAGIPLTVAEQRYFFSLNDRANAAKHTGVWTEETGEMKGGTEQAGWREPAEKPAEQEDETAEDSGADRRRSDSAKSDDSSTVDAEELCEVLENLRVGPRRDAPASANHSENDLCANDADQDCCSYPDHDAAFPSEDAILATLREHGGGPLRTRDLYLWALGEDPSKAQMGAGIRAPFEYALEDMELASGQLSSSGHGKQRVWSLHRNRAGRGKEDEVPAEKIGKPECRGSSTTDEATTRTKGDFHEINAGSLYPTDDAILQALRQYGPLRTRDLYLRGMGKDPKKCEMGAGVRAPFRTLLKALQAKPGGQNLSSQGGGKQEIWKLGK